MTRIPAKGSSFQFLRVVGCVNWWFYYLFIPFAAWGAYARLAGFRVDFANYFFLFLFPIAAGTGLLATARLGQFDLLFGSGRTRGELWFTAFLFAWVIPACLSMIVFAIGSRTSAAGTFGRLIAVLLTTGGIAFFAGLVEVRYFLGVLWLLSRLALVMIPSGLSVVASLERGIDVPGAAMIALIVMLAPETMIGSHVPSIGVIVNALLGLAALFASYRWFCKADFPGKRTS